ncbi:GH92 family glycosyl hydrolase [Salegentibacter salarius]|uniref:Alpha-mannosidase n=1 Tax=Salegentibacter salarius TaxID=435906 RepID=A0A2N0TYP5_9FLAO|nr:GH92 family glycosyl hydrolase [Salegentibacter salarius]OEY72951.1 alpha-mannosidase [Salegentibacter salarius]PKD19849.1 alpha-mannosidase [Salegentibacter salarius]SLJ87054.1 alpha-1,2-mannosidase, putative [Salegentibacter salarius]
MKNVYLSLLAFLIFGFISAQQAPVDYVNPFIGTSNYGATNPGAIAPRGMASVSPFNVAGRIDLNPLEKDSQWLSNPYVYENKFLTGFSHVNMSGVGCPDLGVIITMPTTGELETDHLKYGSTYSEETAKAGYYSANLDKYKVRAEATASTRVGVSRYSFPAGKSNILLNLGLGLTNEQGAMVHVVSPTEIEGMRTVGSFCYNNAEAAYPVYFVANFSKPADEFGIWKTPYNYEGEEAQWMTYNGKTRIKEGFTREVMGDSIGAYMTYDFNEPQEVEVKIGISYVSLENARENLDKEVGDLSFEEVYEQTKEAWNKKLKVVEVEGVSEDDKTIFYTALYHTQIHPNILNDFNGEYPEIATGKTGKTEGTRYTTFSLWDTYRNYHQLMSLLYPQEQLEMVKSMLAMYDENGWLPKWELNSTETFTMVGDPAAVVISDTYLRGLTDFDVEKAYKAMLKSALDTVSNPLRPGLKQYVDNGYVGVDSGVPGPVSTTLEYNIADYAIAQLAKSLGKEKDYKTFSDRAFSYKKLYNSETGFLQPKYSSGKWYQPFDPLAGANFEKNVGYIEGNAWQYLFMVPHDIKGLMKIMGGAESFENKLDKVFEAGHYDMANEPDILYPYLYNYIEGSEYKTSAKVTELIKKYYKNSPAGLPGNDDTGTMSAWLVYSMMGFYPVTPAEPIYTFTKPAFEQIKINLNDQYYDNESIIINYRSSEETSNSDKSPAFLLKDFFINHNDFLNSKKINLITVDN